VLKERYSDGMSLSDALSAALAALAAPGNGERPDMTASQLEVAVLDRSRPHRTFRRLQGARLEELLAESRPAGPGGPAESGGPAGDAPATGPSGPSGPSAPPATGPSAPPSEPGPGTSSGPDSAS
jgi:proteasome alpha subunit